MLARPTCFNTLPSQEQTLCQRDLPTRQRLIKDKAVVRMLTDQFGRDYATQMVSPTERRILANVLNGSVRAKASMQHLALVATELALETPTWTDAASKSKAASKDGELDKSKQRTGPRYHAMRKYVPLCTYVNDCN